MQSAQESKQELEAAIRYAENAISSAKRTIESMEFRQEMAKKQSSEQTGREESLTKLVKELEELNEKLAVDNSNVEKQVQELEERNDGLNAQVADLNVELQRQQGLGQGYYDSMMTLQEERNMLEKNVKYLRDENERLKREKEASSGPCGCQAYRDLEEKVATMPVIPKAVAIAIFREGMVYGASRVCDELDNATDIEISDRECMGNFEVEYTQYVDLSDHLDLDYLRESTGDYDEESVIEALNTLCADNEFECRIHGVDDQKDD